MNKDEIIDALEDERERFLAAIEDLFDEAMEEPGVVGDWSIKDLLSHLLAWEAELVKLLWQAKQGDRPTTIHFQKLSTEEINARWHKETRGRPLERVMDDFLAVRRQTIRRVDAFSNKDLNDPQRFPWLNNHPLWTWIAEDSFKHEAEHTGQVLAWRAQHYPLPPDSG